MPQKIPPYRVEVFYSEEDQGFIARLFQFHGISAFGETQDEAVRELQVATKNWLAALKKKGQEPPEPLDTRRYSGEFRLRVPQELHRELAIEAERLKVSLNTLCVMTLGKALASTGMPKSKIAAKARGRKAGKATGKRAAKRR